MGALLDRWTRAKSEIKLYDAQLVKITETAIFKKINSGSAPVITDSKTELFKTQTKNIFDAIVQNLDVNGDEPKIEDIQGSHKKRSVVSKDKLTGDAFEFLQENATNGLFKKLSTSKANIKIDNKDYEVNISSHRTSVVDLASWKEVIVEGKIPSFVQKISNYLLNLEYEILLIKNNQITIDINGSQYSIRFTGKSKLF